MVGIAEPVAVVGVVGPTNMNYRRAISAVSYVSGLMSTMLAAAYDAPPPAEPGENT